MKKLILISTFFLAGCASGGTVYSSLPPMHKDTAQLVVYHPGEVVGSIQLTEGPDVKVNGKIVCGLSNEHFFVTSINPGRATISSTKMMSVGNSLINIEVQKNKRYFVRITWNNDKVIGALGAGMAGEIATEAVSSHSGPFLIELVDQQTALSELQSLRISPGCPNM